MILRQFAIKNSLHWFLKMEACVQLDLFAVGNTTGAVFIYNIHGDSFKLKRAHIQSEDEEKLSNGGSGDYVDENNGVEDMKDEENGEKSSKGKIVIDKDKEKRKKRNSSNSKDKDEKYDFATPIQASAVLQNYNSKHSVRDVHFSMDSRYLIYCNDTGLIFLWGIVLNSAK